MLEPVKAELKIKALSHFKGDFPRYESAQASGFDIRARMDKSLKLAPRERALIPTGLVFEIPHGFELQVRPRSGLALNKGLTLMNAPGTIDSDYRGELKIIVVNLGLEDIVISDQDRIAQVVCCPVLQARFSIVDEVESSQRGEKGFGSTGIK